MNIKLLVCDDEKLIREGIASLDWEKRGINVVGIARNGEEGFELVEKFKPDIVISDIRMPKKDGIWLAKQIYLNYPDIKIIFLTGYNEFEYAKKAIEYNVSEYLSKPVNENELYATVERLSRDICIMHKAKQTSNKLSNLLAKSKYFLKDFLFNSRGNTISVLDIFGINQSVNLFAATVIKVFTDDTELPGALFMVFEETVDFVNRNLELDVISFFDNNCLLFVFCTGDEKIPSFESKIFAECEKIQQFLDEQFSYHYNIGIGTIVSSCADLHDSYTSAVETLEYIKNIGHGHIIYINDVEPNSQMSAYHSKIFNSYINAIKTVDERSAISNIDELFNSFERINSSLYNTQRRCLSLILRISDALYEMDYNPAILFNNTDAWSVIKKTTSAQELKIFTLNITDVIINHICEIQKRRTENLIEKVKDLVESNYADDASLETIASQVYLSPCYLSVIFKKEMNITFKNYLINTRINKAKELLADTSIKIYEVAEKVGYVDTRYFSELFKKITGLTPSQYRSHFNIV